MRRLCSYIGVTLDGFIAAPDGAFDFFPLVEDVLCFIGTEYPETVPTHLRAQLGIDAANRHFDTVVKGRGTYQPALDAGLTSPYAHLRRYVVSRTVPPSVHPDVHVVADDPAGLVRELEQEPGLDVWLAGGGVLAGALLPEIDELGVKRHSVLIGAGIPMVSAGSGALQLTATGARQLRRRHHGHDLRPAVTA